MANTATTIRIASPTVQFTLGAQPAIVHYARWSPRQRAWTVESYHTTQSAWAVRAPSGTPEGYWSDDEVRADLLAYLADEFGYTDVEIVDPDPPQPEVEVALTHMEQAEKDKSANQASDDAPVSL